MPLAITKCSFLDLYQRARPGTSAGRVEGAAGLGYGVAVFCRVRIGLGREGGRGGGGGAAGQTACLLGV